MVSKIARRNSQAVIRKSTREQQIGIRKKLKIYKMDQQNRAS